MEGVSDSERDLGKAAAGGPRCSLLSPCRVSARALPGTIVSIAAALMRGNTCLPWPRSPKWFKVPSLLCLGSRPPLAEPPRGAGTGVPLPPQRCCAPPVRIARGLGRPGGAGDAPRGSARSRERRSGSSQVPAPCPIAREYFCPRIRSF